MLGIPVEDVDDVMPESLNDKGLNIVFLFALLNFTVTVVERPELAFIITVSLSKCPCVAVATTVTKFLSFS